MSSATNKGRCHICNEWTPANGCEHYLPNAGYIEPKKYESTEQKGLFFWAQRNEIGTIESYVVIAQVDGYPASEAFGDWLARYEDADRIAQDLSQGKDIY